MQAIPLIGAAAGIGSLFSGGSSSKATQSSRPTDLTLPWFQQLGQGVAGTLGNTINGGPQNFNPYGGPLTGNIGLNEQQQLQFLQQTALNPQRAGLLNSTLSGSFLPGGQNQNPYLQSAIEMAQRPTAEALQNAVGRQIPGMFAAAGQQAGQRVGGGGSTAKDLNVIRASEVGGRALGDIATGISSNAYNTERGLQNQAIQLQQNDIQAMLANLAGQGLPRNIADQGIQRAIALNQQGSANWLQSLAIAAGLPLQTVGNIQQGTSTGASPSLLTGLFGNQGAFGGVNSALAPTLSQGGQTVPNPTIFNSPTNPFANLFG